MNTNFTAGQLTKELTARLVGQVFTGYSFDIDVLREVRGILGIDPKDLSISHEGNTVYVLYKNYYLLYVDVKKQRGKYNPSVLGCYYGGSYDWSFKEVTVTIYGNPGDNVDLITVTERLNEIEAARLDKAKAKKELENKVITMVKALSDDGFNLQDIKQFTDYMKDNLWRSEFKENLIACGILK